MRILAVAALLALSLCAVAQQANVPKKQWLLTVKPMMSQRLCTGVGSPFKRTYKGNPESCKADVERLFGVCANDEPTVELPDTFTSVQHGRWYGQVLAECISAHYQGGEALEAFRALQRQGLQGPDDSAAFQPTIDATVKLTFLAFPDVEHERTRNMIARYSYIARGWWVELRCELLEPEKRSTFKANVADATMTMRSILSDEPALKYSPQKQTEIIQMYALRYASENSFFGCQNRASALVAWAYESSEDWSDVLAQATGRSRSGR